LLKLDIAFQNSTLFDAEPTGEDVSIYDCRLAQVNATRSLHIACKMTKYGDVADGDIGTNTRIWANGQTASLEGDGSFDISVDVKVLISGELSSDNDRLTDDGGTLCWFHRRFFLP